jgi:hypothetical protein
MQKDLSEKKQKLTWEIKSLEKNKKEILDELNNEYQIGSTEELKNTIETVENELKSLLNIELEEESEDI